VAHLKGDAAAAAHFANLQAADTFPFGLLARALVAANEGDHIRAQRTLIRLTMLYPGWSNPRRMIERFVRAPDIVDRLSRDIDAITRP
jgi:hypothetical protein